MTALLGQYLGDRRVGFVNFALYGLASSESQSGSSASLHPIANGDNWFYHGRNGYNPAAGLGTLDVANFAKALGRDD